MRDAFKRLQPGIWSAAEKAYVAATSDLSGLYMPLDLYEARRRVKHYAPQVAKGAYQYASLEQCFKALREEKQSF